jgi:hypothetical protein
MRRRNQISGQFSPRLIEMLESPAYRTLSLSAHRVISRIEIELAQHGGNDNGKLPVTTMDFVEYGVERTCVPAAIREGEALGFIRVTERGRGGNAEFRKPNLFALMFAHDRNSRQAPPTHDWRKIKTMDEAEKIARAARANKDPIAVAKATNRKRNAGLQKPPKASAEKPVRTRSNPSRKNQPTWSGGKTSPLSISREGTALPDRKATDTNDAEEPNTHQ